MATCVLAVAAIVAVSIAVPALVVAAAPAIAALAPVITGAVGGAVSYTATKIAVNTVNERPAMEGFSAIDCATNAAAGACFSQVSSIIGNAILNKPINVGSGNNSFSTGSKQAALEAADNLPVDNATNFIKDRANSCINYSLTQNTDGNYIIQATMPGRDPGCTSIYYKYFTPDGDDLIYGHDGFDHYGFTNHNGGHWIDLTGN